MFAQLFAAFVSIMTHSDNLPNLSRLDQKQVQCIAEVIYHEARGESFEGQAAVAAVVFNRAIHTEFPDTWCKVIYEPGQFEWVRKTRRGHVHAKNNPVWASSYNHAVTLSIQYHLGYDIGPMSVRSASFFSRDGFKNPKLLYADQIGGHKFYELMN